MANLMGAISNVQPVNPTTEPAAAKPAVTVAKTTPQDVNISAAARAAGQTTQSKPPADADYDGDNK